VKVGPVAAGALVVGFLIGVLVTYIGLSGQCGP